MGEILPRAQVLGRGRGAAGTEAPEETVDAAGRPRAVCGTAAPRSAGATAVLTAGSPGP
ncbi:hypothetical protein [Streptomyces sp. NPDC058953]|uniref:hypothetical protein n=1 Tax=unclassified Streptomyces TaxID=2593676 RepID=UPI0036977D15